MSPEKNAKQTQKKAGAYVTWDSAHPVVQRWKAPTVL